MQLIIALLVFVAVASGDDDCAVPYFPATHCCEVADIFPHFKKTGNEACLKQHLQGQPTETTAQMKEAYSCVLECSFLAEGMLTADNKLDRTAVINFFHPSDAALVPEVVSILERCFDKYDDHIEDHLECTSGAIEFVTCFKRELLINCPSSRWSPTSDCDDIKTKVAKCITVPVHLLDFD